MGSADEDGTTPQGALLDAARTLSEQDEYRRVYFDM
jgi:hypothetical protein